MIDESLARQGGVLVEERVLRRIIKGHRKLRGIGLQVPHETCYSLPRAELEQHVEREEMAIDPATLPERVVVVSAERAPVEAGSAEALTALWRSLFHAKIHQAFDEMLARRALTRTAIKERINRVGQTEFDEIRSVLEQEDLLLPPVDEVAMYVEFVALYLELKYFSPATLGRTFPALFDTSKVDATIALDILPEQILAAAHPRGAPEAPVVEAEETPELEPEPVRMFGEAAKKSAAKAAAKARDKGNRSRAAILNYRAGLDRSGEADLAELIARLGRALAPPPDSRHVETVKAAAPPPPGGLDPDTAKRWVAALVPVALFAARQSSPRFSVGARLLFDLQAACVVAEREVRVFDLVTWAMSFGKRPLVRALPATREVRIAKKVHAAVAKIPACGVPSEQLSDALREMSARADANVRAVTRPKIEAALVEVDLVPHSLPERVGEKKLVDELLDRAVAIGRLSIGNLRDGISKNDLKCTDLTFTELKSGDQLLRCDKILSHSLDGVYRRGESYMRFLQKLSSLFFGTPIGRFLTLYLILPYVGAIAVVDGIHHMVGPLWSKATGVHPEISTFTNKLVCAGFLFLLIHLRPFRTLAIWVGLKIWRGIKFVIWDVPRALWFAPVFNRIVVPWVIQPAIPALLVYLLEPAVKVEPIGEVRIWSAIVVFGCTAFLINSRFGKKVEERLTDWAVRSGRHVTKRLLPGAVKLILELFVRLLELLDRGIYRVDEFLRFKSGQSAAVRVLKGSLGTLWFILTYFLRLYINLFIEPTVNPIKHFPVVTVAAKLIIPIIPSMLSGLTNALTPLLGSALAGGFAGFTVIVIPGLAGFLVWELKENWKLYRATRSKTLRPLAIGHHGESMQAFLKPGFHSGTIPKHYTKLRRASWKGDERGVAKQKEGLHHVEEAVGNFVDRQLVSMLNEVPSFTATDVALGHVEIGSNRIQFELACPSIAAEPALIRFEQQSGWLVASIPQTGWLGRLDDHHRRIFEIALSGFYKLSGVDIVREQIEHVLKGDAAEVPAYDISDEGLLVWPGDGYDSEAIYNLKSARLKVSVRSGEIATMSLPSLDGHHALFGREPLYWSVWSTAWQQIARGEPPMHLLVGPPLMNRTPAQPAVAA